MSKSIEIATAHLIPTLVALEATFASEGNDLMALEVSAILRRIRDGSPPTGMSDVNDWLVPCLEERGLPFLAHEVSKGIGPRG